MGLLTWWRVKRMKDPVYGSLTVSVCAQPESLAGVASAYYSALVLGVVEAPGVPPQAVEFSCSIPSARCPRSGQRVPVIVDRSRPSKIVIRWDRVPKRHPLQDARQAAQRAAQAERARRRPL